MLRLWRLACCVKEPASCEPIVTSAAALLRLAIPPHPDQRVGDGLAEDFAAAMMAGVGDRETGRQGENRCGGVGDPRRTMAGSETRAEQGRRDPVVTIAKLVRPICIRCKDVPALRVGI
jgi:hypothetical protein